MRPLPWWIRVPIALVFIGAGIIFLFVPTDVFPPVYTSGISLGVGLFLLLWGPSDGEKKGYHI
jgi:hypothetical protein